MEGMLLIFIGLGLLVVFDLLALALGADSRDAIGDDHVRPVRGWSGW